MSLVEHAKRELEFLNDGDELNELIHSQVMEIVKMFGSHNHSGLSARYAISLIIPLLEQEPIKPLQGTEDEWIEVAEGVFQNKRCSHVFKHKNGRAYDLDGKVFKDGNGNWYTNNDSKIYIEFPYVPKTVYVEG